MHIENMTINVSGAPDTAAAFLQSLQGVNYAPAGQPAIGELWLGRGGIYAGVSRSEGGKPDAHLVLHVGEPTGKLSWQDALTWAEELEVDGHTDFRVPTRFESALLYANLRDLFDHSAWYWTGTQSSQGDAFVQDFYYGYQGIFGEKAELRVRAVRRFAL